MSRQKSLYMLLKIYHVAKKLQFNIFMLMHHRLMKLQTWFDKCRCIHCRHEIKAYKKESKELHTQARNKILKSKMLDIDFLLFALILTIRILFMFTYFG